MNTTDVIIRELTQEEIIARGPFHILAGKETARSLF